MKFILESSDKSARAGRIQINNKEILTPVFMPVGTQACVKALDFNDLDALGAKIILANTYHLFLRPTASVIEKMGGLHNFSGFKSVFLTDSGGFQAFSLNGKPSENGILFTSHIDGSKIFFTPQSVLDTQYALNSDIMMILDDLIKLPNSKERVLESINKTNLWAQESIKYHSIHKKEHANNHIFAIIQGGIDPEMRKKSADSLINCHYENTEFDGFAIGGLAVGEEKSAMYDTIFFTTNLMPTNKPRYLMGVGTPEDLIEGIARGVDMFDCVMPTRNARNGTIFTNFGRISIKNANFKLDSNPIDKLCSCYACRHFSRAYLNHLFRANEPTYARLASIHNLAFYLNLMERAREAIINKTFELFKKDFYAKFKQ